MLYVDARDVEPRANGGACKDTNGGLGVGNASCPIQLKAGKAVEPLVIRANAGDCRQPAQKLHRNAKRAQEIRRVDRV